MTGGDLVGLILLSMAWCFFVLGLALNYALRRKPGGMRGALGPFPGMAGSLAVYFSLPLLARHGVEMPWPWLWILLPLALDPGCAAAALRAVLYRRRRNER